MKTVFHARLHGRFIEKNNKLHRANQDTSFHEGGLGNGGNEEPLFNLEEKDNPSILKVIFSSRKDTSVFTSVAPELLGRSNKSTFF